MRWMPHCVRRSRMKSETSVVMSVLSVSREERRQPAVEVEEQAPRLRLVVERPVGGEVAFDGLEEVAGTFPVEGLVRLLCLVAVAREIAVEEAGRDLLAVDRLQRWPADDELAPWVARYVDDRFGRELGLEDGRNGLRLARHLRATPAELRRVVRREIDHRQAHIRSVVEELGAERFCEAAKRGFRAAVGGLKRDRPVRER